MEMDAFSARTVEDEREEVDTHCGEGASELVTDDLDADLGTEEREFPQCLGQRLASGVRSITDG